MPVTQSFVTAAYEASASTRGRRRGRGRGEQPSGRGRSVSTASMSSVLSEGETVVGDAEQPAEFENIVEV